MPPLAAVLAILLVLGLGAVGLRILASTRGPGGLRPRRLLQGIACALAALALLAYWRNLQGEIAGTRQVLVVYSHDLERAEAGAVGAPALERLRPLLEGVQEVAFLRLETGPAPAADGRPAPPPRFLAAGHALDGGWAAIARQAEALPVLVEVRPGEPDRGGWLDLLTRKAHEIFDQTSRGPWSRPTLLILVDDGQTWRGLRLPAGLAREGRKPEPPIWESALRLLLDEGIQLFVVDLPVKPGPGRLEITSLRDIWPAGTTAPDLLDKLSIRLFEIPSDEAGSWRVRRLWSALDDRPLRTVEARDLENPELEVSGDDEAPYLLVHPSELFSGSLGSEGFHRLSVRVEVAPPGGEKPRIYEGVRYLRAENRRVLVLHPAGLGQLAAESWGAAARMSFPDFLSQRLSAAAGANRSRLSVLGELQENASDPLPGLFLQPLPAATGYDEATLQRLRDALRDTRALVIVEPTQRQLETLARQLDLERAIRNGIDVLVIGPPPRDDAALPWLPAAAVAAGNDVEPLLAYRDPRLYILPDNSRVTQLPASKDDLRSLQDVQREVIAEVRRQLGASAVHQGPDWKIAASPATEGRLGDRRLTIFPTVDLTANLQGLDRFYQGSGGSGTRLDLLPSRPSDRLRAVLGRAGDPYFREHGIRDPHLYPQTFVLLFALDLPVIDGNAGADRLRLSRPDGLLMLVTQSSGPPVLPRDLARLGIRPLLVRLRIPAPYEQHYRGALQTLGQGAPVTGCPPAQPCPLDGVPKPYRGAPLALPEWSVAVDSSAGDLAAVVAGIVRMIEENLPLSSGLGVLERLRGGRAIDERGLASRPAPRLQTVLEPPSADVLERPHAVVEDGRPPDHLIHLPLPGLVVRRFGEGEVAVLAASPFARDLWLADVEPPAGNRPAADGWGMQRLIDLVDLTGAARPLPEAPIVLGLRELEDGRTLQIEAWTRLFGTSGWRLPEIVAPDGTVTPLDIVQVAPTAHRITLQYRPAQKVQGLGELVLDPDASAGPEARSYLHLNLLGGLGGERTIRETLAALAALSGGAVIDPVRDVDLVEARRRLVNPLPGSWIFGALLCGLLILLLSPPVRPWTGAALALRSWRSRRRAPEGLVPPEAILDTEAILAEWGFQPGLPSAARRAGTPAAEKLWEAGDDLAGARPSTLVPFTSLGRRIGLPPCRPRLRQRHVTRAMEAVLLIDNSRSLLVPHDPRLLSKRDFAPLVASLLARVVWLQAGSVRAAAARSQGRDATWGPSTSDDDAANLEAFVRARLSSQSGRLAIPDLEPGQVVFLVSDLLAFEEAEIEELTVRCGRDGIDLRLAHLLDPAEKALVGLVWNAEAGVYHDRTEWDPAELTQAYAERIARFRHLVEQAEGRFITLTTDSRAETVREDLREQAFLS